MGRIDQLVGGKAKLPGAIEERVQQGRVETWAAGQDPQIAAVRAADQRISVILLVKGDNIT
ncbi:MAG: hypothetical protein BA871_17460 [Desulfuromonadales bacterium C00003096]|jgi:hypothetical protein|nr:MAG: hypothetical protein BA871_17460 [Desulfuromonadales bacterium C00003096]